MRIENIEFNEQSTDFEIETAQDESYGLIYLANYREKKFLQISRIGAGHKETIPTACEPFIRISMLNHSKLIIETSKPNLDLVHGKLFLGSWGEMLLQEININLNHHYHIYERPDTIQFQIGLKDKSNIFVSPDVDNRYYKMVVSIDGEPKVSEVIEVDSEVGALVNEIYGKIRENCANSVFSKRQIEAAHQLQNQTEDTLKRNQLG